jgi:hypothetical protein
MNKDPTWLQRRITPFRSQSSCNQNNSQNIHKSLRFTSMCSLSSTITWAESGLPMRTVSLYSEMIHRKLGRTLQHVEPARHERMRKTHSVMLRSLKLLSLWPLPYLSRYRMSLSRVRSKTQIVLSSLSFQGQKIEDQAPRNKPNTVTFSLCPSS